MRSHCSRRLESLTMGKILYQFRCGPRQAFLKRGNDNKVSVQCKWPSNHLTAGCTVQKTDTMLRLMITQD